MTGYPNSYIQDLIARCRAHLADVVAVSTYEYAPCYLWYDRPLFDSFGDEIRRLPGDTIYLFEHSTTPVQDLLHELGHVVGRKCNLVGHSKNGYRGSWEEGNKRLISQISANRHWSQYLNDFALGQKDFRWNAASEIWAELFMLWHLYPHSTEAELVDAQMLTLQHQPICRAIETLAAELRPAASFELSAAVEIPAKRSNRFG